MFPLCTVSFKLRKIRIEDEKREQMPGEHQEALLKESLQSLHQHTTSEQSLVLYKDIDVHYHDKSDRNQSMDTKHEEQGSIAESSSQNNDSSNPYASGTSHDNYYQCPTKLVDFKSLGIDLQSYLTGIPQDQSEAVRTLASGHITRIQIAYNARAKERIDTLQHQCDASIAKLKEALERDIEETKQATNAAIKLDAQKFEREYLPSLLSMLKM